jgi:hypothetical protein
MQKEATTMHTDTRIYLVKINWKSTRGKFMFKNAHELMNILKQDENASKGIESLKTFDSAKDKFVRISKSDFLTYNSYETEAMEYLKQQPYFKK